MTDKDPKDMTASEILRDCARRSTRPELAASEYYFPETYVDDYTCDLCGLFRALADKIDAELAQARNESLLQGAELWAKANGWPDFRDGEDFGAWLDRCFLPRPRFEDGEPVQLGEEIELHYRGGGMDKGRFQEIKYNKGPVWMLSFTGVDHAREYRYDSECDTIKRPAPEVLGADGLPIKAGETAWLTEYGAALAGTSRFDRGADSHGLCGVSPDEALVVKNPASSKHMPGHRFVSFEHESAPWCPASWLTHTPPDAQESIDADKGKSGTEYWGCSGLLCGDCPAEIDGKRPSDRYGVLNCSIAQGMDIARRQADLDARKGGE